MKHSTARSCVAAVGVLATTLTTAALTAGPATARPAEARSVLTAPCLDSSTALSVEENRLTYRLPDNDDPSTLQDEPFAQQMIEGAGFQSFGATFVRALCHSHTAATAFALAHRDGRRLWRMAVDRAQRHGRVRGDLPYSDDRPLYWARLQATAALRQWAPDFGLPGSVRSALITTFDRASRGMFDIDFPAGKRVERVIMSGFDPYTLDGGPAGTAPGAAGNNLRHGNPSGATALSLDGTTYRTKSGKRAVIEAYVLTVNYTEFRRGYLEDTVGPFLLPGPRQADASVTVSQAGDSVFDLEQWNGRYHGVSPGNDNSQPCPTVNGVPQLAVDNHGCDIQVVRRWGGPAGFDLHNPP